MLIELLPPDDQTVSYDKAKEIATGMIAAFVDRTVETKGLHFFNNEALHALDAVFIFESEVERLVRHTVRALAVCICIYDMEETSTNRGADGLVRGVVPDVEVRVLKGLLAGDTLCGVEVEQLAQEVDGKRVCTREERLEGHARLDGQRADVVLGLNRANRVNKTAKKTKI